MRLLLSAFLALSLPLAFPTTAAADPVPASYSPLGSGAAPSIPGNPADVRALAYGPDGSLYAGGDFQVMGGVTVNGIARWDGTSWSALGSGTNGSVLALAFDASGRLYVAGDFTFAGGIAGTAGIARWTGTAWEALPGGGVAGAPTTVHALAFVGSRLYIGGSFTNAGAQGGPSVNASSIASFDGTAWSALGSGIGGRVLALEPDGVGGIYVGGDFTSAGGGPAFDIARWDGTSWSALGSGTNGSVQALAMSDGVLYVGGSFTSAGGQSAGMVAAWTGSSWFVPPASQLDYVVHAIEPQSDGSLIAGGAFVAAGSEPMLRLARWDGSAWGQVGSGIPGTYGVDYVGALAIAPDGSIVIGGTFSSAGGVSAANIARVTFGATVGGHPPVHQGVPLNAQGTCAPMDDAAFAYGTGISGGWVRSWQEWMTDASGVRTGGWGCSRTLVHTGTSWIVDGT